MVKKAVSIDGALLVVLSVIAIGLVYFSSVFTVKSIEVHGARNASVEEMVNATGIAKGSTLVSADIESAAVAVTQVPWVKKATVAKKWPSTIGVSVEEQVAVAFVTTSEGTTLINADGEPFVIDQPPLGTVEFITASVEDSRVFSACIEMLNALTPAVRKDVARINAPSAYELTLELLDGRQVYWGSAEQAADKALATEDILSQPGERFNVSNPRLVTVG